MANFEKRTDEIEFNSEDLVFLDSGWIDRAKAIASKNKKKKFRTCFHFDESDDVHEMFIVHCKETYVRPHKHITRYESLQILEGVGTVIIFSDDGKITQVQTVGDISSPHPFYYYMRRAAYHTILIHTDFLIFKETTQGPFNPKDTVFPGWAPSDVEDSVTTSNYFSQLHESIKNTKKG